MEHELSQAFSRYAVSFQLNQLAAHDYAHLVDAFVNWVGCAIGGAQSPTADAAARGFSSMSPSGAFRALGRPESFDLVNAISMDCLTSAVLAFDDTHLETVLHPTGPVAAALLGAARIHEMSGRDYIAALHVGMEVECRAGLAITAAGTGAKGGWYSTGLAGGIGAAVAVGRIRGFDEALMRNAIGLAAAYACGNRGTHGSMAAAYVPAIAAANGFVAAKLTEAGLTCSARAFDGRSGLLDLVTDSPGVERALRHLGSVSEATRTAFKPYPSGIVTHPVIDACLLLLKRHGISASNLASVQFRVSQRAFDLVANKHPKDPIQAQVSLFYWGAVALLSGSAGLEQTAPHLVTDPDMAALQERMSAEVGEDLADDQCIAIAKLADGRTVELFVEHAVGSVNRPMTSAEIDAKFLALAGASMSAGRTERLHQACRSVLSQQRVGAILEV